MTEPEAYEFDVVVTVLKRIHVAGPTSVEAARMALKSAIQDGLGFGPFAKYGADGRPIERVISNEFELVHVDPRETLTEETK